MTCQDLYLRTDTDEALRAACPFLWDPESNDWISGTTEFAFSVIGPVVTSPGVYDEEGAEVMPAIMDNRFHANLRCTEAIAFMVPEEIRVEPNSPSRVWL